MAFGAGWFSDEYCPHCDNHYVLDAKIPKPALKIEGEDARVDARYSPRLSPVIFIGGSFSLVQLVDRKEWQDAQR